MHCHRWQRLFWRFPYPHSIESAGLRQRFVLHREAQSRAWAHWHLNDNATRGAQPISYGELLKRTGIEFLPGVHPDD